MFASGDLGVYFGFASEYAAIAARKPPNLHFSVAVLPQVENGTRVTFGNITGLAIARSAANVQGGARRGAGALGQSRRRADSGSAQPAAGQARREPRHFVASVFVNSALISRGWLDPDSAATDGIFQSMIESVVSGALTPSAAVNEGVQSLQALFTKQ